MDFGKLAFDKVVAEWDTVSGHPGAFIAALALGAVVAWIAARLWYAEQLTHNRNVIADLRAKIGEGQGADKEKRQRLIEVLSEAFDLTRQLTQAKITNDDELKTLTSGTDEFLEQLQKELKGKVSDAEIKALVTAGGGPRLSFRGFYNRQHVDLLNYLHYLDDRIRKLIDKYG